MNMAEVEEFYNAVAKDYHRIYELGEKPSYQNGIGDYFRLQIVLRLLAAARAKSVFEVGVGDGTPLKHMHLMGLRVAGCDITSGMVERANATLREAGISEPRIWRADICNAVELAPAMMAEPSDALVVLGVMPHVEKEALALRNMRTLVKSGGKLLIEFRNSLFSLFTFNRYTHDFIVNELLAGVSDETRKAVSQKLAEHVRMDLPPVRDKTPDGSGPGYDLIKAKFHNPFELPSLLQSAGFINPVFHWYHYHAAPPMLQNDLGSRFDTDSIAMEHRPPNDWRGYFLCSAVLVEADAD